MSPRLLPERVTSFARGFNDSAAPTDYRPDEVRVMENCRPSFAGTAVERRSGSRKLHGTALNGGAFFWGATEFFTAAGQQQICVFAGDTFQVSTDGGATWTDESGVVNITEDWWTFAIMRVGTDEFLFAANGGTDVLQWDGTTLSVLTASQGSVPAGVKFLAVANDRLYLSGHNGPEVHATDVGDPTNFDTTQGAFTVRVHTHDGDTEIRGMYQFGAALLVWKRRSTNYIEGFGVQTIQVESGPRGASRSVGCAGHRTVTAVGSNGVMWLSERGFEYFDGGEIHLVSRRQQRFIDTIDWGAISDDPLRPVAIYYERKHEYLCIVPRTGGATQTAIYVFRLPLEGSPAAAYIFKRADTGGATGDYFEVDVDGYVTINTAGGGVSTSVDSDGYQVLDADQSGDPVTVDGDGYVETVKSDTFGGVLFVADTEDDLAVPHEGTANGFVLRLEDGDTDFAEPDLTGGNSITMRLEGRPFLYGDSVQRKRARIMRATFSTPATANVTMAVEVDGVETFNRAVSIMSSGDPVQVRERVNGRGRTIVPIIETTGDVQVRSLEIESYFMRRN